MPTGHDMAEIQEQLPLVDKPQLPPSLTTDDQAPPSTKTAVAEAKRRFVIPEDDTAQSEPLPKPAQKTADDKASSGEAEPKDKAETSDATQEGSAAEKPQDEPKKEPTPEQAEKRRQERRFERRLEKERRQRAEARAEADLLRKQLAEIEQRSKPQSADGEPKLEDFDYDPDKFSAALREYTHKKTSETFEHKQRQDALHQAEQALLSSWEEQVRKAEDKYEDFESLVGELKPDSALSIAIMESEIGGELAYYLVKHPDVADRITALKSPIAQVRELGRVEAGILQPSASPKTPSKAPPPIETLSPAPTVVTDVPSEQDDFGTWMRKRQKQVYGSRR